MYKYLRLYLKSVKNKEIKKNYFNGINFFLFLFLGDHLGNAWLCLVVSLVVV